MASNKFSVLQQEDSVCCVLETKIERGGEMRYAGEQTKVEGC